MIQSTSVLKRGTDLKAAEDVADEWGVSDDVVPPASAYRMRHVLPAVGISLMLVVAAVGARMSVAKSPAAGQTIQATMDKVVDPAADALWESVGTIESAKGEEHRAPRSDIEWSAVQGHAEQLIRGARMLQQPDLPVGGVGGGLADAKTPGIRTPKDIRADIDRDPAKFIAAADRLKRAAQQALAASAAHDPAGLLAAGAQIDAACEACHAAYWYPRRRLGLPSDEDFARTALHPEDNPPALRRAQ